MELVAALRTRGKEVFLTGGFRCVFLANMVPLFFQRTEMAVLVELWHSKELGVFRQRSSSLLLCACSCSCVLSYACMHPLTAPFSHSHNREIVLPIAEHLDIPAKNVFANSMSWELDDKASSLMLMPRFLVLWPFASFAWRIRFLPDR